MTSHGENKRVRLIFFHKEVVVFIGISLLAIFALTGVYAITRPGALRNRARVFQNELKSVIVGVNRNPSATPIGAAQSIPARGPLRVDPANPRYFTDGSGKAILLAGSSNWYTLVDGDFNNPPKALDYDAYLNFIKSRGHNFFRFFAWEQARWTVKSGAVDYYYNPPIYMRTGPGYALDNKLKFDLNQFNQAYFDRLRARIIKAGNQGIYVSVMLFEGFSIDKANVAPANNPWYGHPYNVNNNINGIDGDPAPLTNGHKIQQLTLPQTLPQITALQEAYVRKVIDTVNDLDNVLYEICNESAPGTAEINWQNHMINYIHTYEAGKAKQHPVGFGITYPSTTNQDLFNSAADWIEPGPVGGYDTDPPANDGKKVIVNDTDHTLYPNGDRVWVWKSFTRGMNVLFMDPYVGGTDWTPSGYYEFDPQWESLRYNLGYIRDYANRINLEKMIPHGELASTGYALANTAANAAEYLVYLPNGGSVTVDLSAALGDLRIEWFIPNTGIYKDGGIITGGAMRSFSYPFSGDGVLYLYPSPAPCPSQSSVKCSFLPILSERH